MTCLLKATIVKPVTRNTGVTGKPAIFALSVPIATSCKNIPGGRGVFCGVHAEAMYQGAVDPHLRTKTDVFKVLLPLCYRGVEAG